MVWEELFHSGQRTFNIISPITSCRKCKVLTCETGTPMSYTKSPLNEEGLPWRKGFAVLVGRKRKQWVLFLEIKGENKSPVIISKGYQNSGTSATFYVCYVFILFFPPESKATNKVKKVRSRPWWQCRRRMLKGPCFLCGKSWVRLVVVDNMQEDSGSSWRKESKLGPCGLLKEENTALG